MNTTDERHIDPLVEMSRIAQNILDLQTRGFEKNYQSTASRKLIFNSQWCRLSLIWSGWDYLGGNSMHILYGRLHAPSDKNTMVWQGEECRCWHQVDYVLHFLDKRNPEDAAKLHVSHPITDPFYESEITQKFHRRQPEWMAEMHIAIWQHYGQRLFNLFDLRQPDLWQQYQHFLKEVYDIAGRTPRPGPPMDKVC